MISTSATPIDIVERYFDVELKARALKRFDTVTEDEWVAFAVRYRQTMELNFADQFLTPERDGDALLRLYLEPRMMDEWDRAAQQWYGPTPLLGRQPDPGPASGIPGEAVSRMLAPLKKHLLIADSIYIRDSFYYCFDGVADLFEPDRWRDDPIIASHVRLSICKLKAWLPILVELRPLIDSRALVFMPYYVTPSFPYGGTAPALKNSMQKLRMRRLPQATPAPAPGQAPTRLPSVPTITTRFDEDDVLAAWLNARLLGLDPVFPRQDMFEWAANLYFAEDLYPAELISDLLSMNILPFGRAEGLSLADLQALRKNEEVFDEVRRAVTSCKDYVEANVGKDASRETVSVMCNAHLRDRLERLERGSVLRFVDEQPVAGIAVSIAIGAALIPAAPVVGVLAGAVLSPNLARAVQRRFGPERRAISHLQALL